MEVAAMFFLGTAIFFLAALLLVVRPMRMTLKLDFVQNGNDSTVIEKRDAELEGESRTTVEK